MDNIVFRRYQLEKNNLHRATVLLCCNSNRIWERGYRGWNFWWWL